MGLRKALGLRRPRVDSMPTVSSVLPRQTTAPYQNLPTIEKWEGYCPICKGPATFRAHDTWYRGSLFCQSCPNGSVPRERAMMVVLDRVAPNWRNLKIHESSPSERGFSIAVRDACEAYVSSQYFPDVPGGVVHKGMRCEDIERQTFADESFDLVLTQDVMEHVFHPDLAYREVARTLKPGGVYIHTTPIYKTMVTSERKAELKDGEIVYLAEPEYHGNPVGDGRALVTFRYGYDLPKLIASWAPFAVEIWRPHDKTRGLIAEFLEVIICTKIG